MGLLLSVLGLPVNGPLGAFQWIAKQVAETVQQQMLDPSRIEVALRALETRLEAGAINEDEFEAEELILLAELSEMHSILAGLSTAGVAADGADGR